VKYWRNQVAFHKGTEENYDSTITYNIAGDKQTHLELDLQLGVKFLHLLQCLLCVAVTCSLDADLMSMILLQVLNVSVQVLRSQCTDSCKLDDKVNIFLRTLTIVFGIFIQTRVIILPNFIIICSPMWCSRGNAFRHPVVQSCGFSLRIYHDFNIKL